MWDKSIKTWFSSLRAGDSYNRFLNFLDNFFSGPIKILAYGFTGKWVLDQETAHLGSDPNLWGPKPTTFLCLRHKESEGKACLVSLPGVLWGLWQKDQGMSHQYFDLKGQFQLTPTEHLPWARTDRSPWLSVGNSPILTSLRQTLLWWPCSDGETEAERGSVTAGWPQRVQT